MVIIIIIIIIKLYIIPQRVFLSQCVLIQFVMPICISHIPTLVLDFLKCPVSTPTLLKPTLQRMPDCSS